MLPTERHHSLYYNPYSKREYKSKAETERQRKRKKHYRHQKTTKSKNKLIQVDPAYNAVNIIPISGHGFLTKKARINSITVSRVKSSDLISDDVYVSHQVSIIGANSLSKDKFDNPFDPFDTDNSVNSQDEDNPFISQPFNIDDHVMLIRGRRKKRRKNNQTQK